MQHSPAAEMVPTSVRLKEAAQGLSGGRITLDDFIQAGGERGLLLAIVLCSLPNTLPIPLPPGLSTVFAAPAWCIALQVLLGREQLWMPAFLRRKTLSAKVGGTIFRKGAEWFAKLERIVRPRPLPLPLPVAERLSALIIMGLCILIALPIPFANLLPAVSVVLICVGLMERDGVFLIIGWAMSALAMCWVSLILFGAFKGISFGLERFGLSL